MGGLFGFIDFGLLGILAAFLVCIIAPHSSPATNPQARQFQRAAWVAALLRTIVGPRAVLGSQHSPAREDAPIGSNAPGHSSCNREGYSQRNLFII